MSTRPKRTTRPRRAVAPVSTPTPPRARRKPAAARGTPHGAEVVGRLIEVEWPSPDDPVTPFYVALVLSFNVRRNQHKLVYLEDESIESCLLGSGSPHRRWRPTEQPSNVLIGARIRLQDPDSPAPGSKAWYDFMRINPTRRNLPFEVYVYARIRDPDPNEISGPRATEHSDGSYYRVIHAPNDYLTTIDLSSVKYIVEVSLKDIHERVKAQVHDAAAADDTPGGDEVDVGNNESGKGSDQDNGEHRDVDENTDTAQADGDNSTPVRSRVRTTPSKSVDVIPDDDVLPVDLDGSDGGGGPDLDEDRIEPDRRAVEGSPATPDTRDDPVASERHGVELVLDEGNAIDAASEEEHLGWASRSEGGAGAATNGGSQVGEYICLADNGGRRNAYVSAFLPGNGNHFVTFCDAQGGNMQVELTEDNHWVLSDKEVAALTRTQARRDVASARGKGGDDGSIELEGDQLDNGGQEVDLDADEPLLVVNDDDHGREPVRKVGKKIGRGRGKARRERDSSDGRSSGGLKKKAKRRISTGKILGKNAGHDIVSRCVTVVWPDTTLVYVALVMGYSEEKNQHMLLYMSDHCVETLELRYREWQLLPRGKEPWNSSGMVGKRVFVWWPGEYVDAETQERAEEVFSGERSKVAYEAYVLTFIGQGKYKIIYPSNEDCEERELSAEKSEGDNPVEKEWDILEEGMKSVNGLPVIGWEGE